ncbi:MAG TPA: sensor histidine kinase [Fluviicola sp.]|nr:sensor histidine kinase [Fluviicola sp.]
MEYYNKRAFELAESDLTKAFKLSEKAEGMINESTDSILISDVYSVRGTLYQTAEKYEQAILWHQKALGLRKRYGDLKKISNSKFNLANLYYQTENFKLSKEYHLESLAEILQTNVDEVDLITRYNSLGSLYKDLGKRDSALFYLNKSLKIIERNDLTSSDDAMNVYLNLGIVYEEQGEYQLSLQYLEKAIPIQKELENTGGLSLSYHHIGIVNELKREFPTAEKYYNMAMALAEKLGDVEAIKNVSFSKAKLFAKVSNQDSTLYYFDKYADFSDKLQRLTQSKKILELDTQYKTKEKEVALKNAEEREDIYIWSAAIISLTFLLILFFLIRNYRQKQRIALLQVDLKNNEINELLNQQENASYAAMLEGQDQERLRIARELHDRLGSTLATIKLGLQNEKIPEAQQQVALVNTAISEVRTISHDLSGGNIEQYGLAAALTELKHTLDRSGKITLNLFMEAVNIQASLHVTIYRIVQELVSNTLKHAEATEITLQLSTVDDQLNLIYEDNGKGFDLSHYQPGMGITNIRHRLEKWHGTIEIDAQPNRGTITILTVPITMPHD